MQEREPPPRNSDRPEAKIDTSMFGLAKDFTSPKTGNTVKCGKHWIIQFDTGIALIVPDSLMDNMVFHLEETDPKPPK